MESKGTVEKTMEILAGVDYSRVDVTAILVSSSFLFFLSVYCISGLIGSLTWTYRNLRTKEKVFWNLAVVRGTFGLFAAVVGVHAIWWDTELRKDVILATTPLSHNVVGLTVGFFLLECLILTMSDVYYKSFNLLLHIHHWISLAGYVIVLCVNKTHYFACVGLLLEMTTPFSALCWTLLKCGLAETKIWKANQFILVHLFHCRTLVEGFIWIETYRHFDNVWSNMPLSIFILLYVQLFLVTFVMTPYWTYKKTVQMIIPTDWNFVESEQTKATNGSAKKVD